MKTANVVKIDEQPIGVKGLSSGKDIIFDKNRLLQKYIHTLQILNHHVSVWLSLKYIYFFTL